MNDQNDAQSNAMGRPLPTMYYEKDGILYVVENEISPNAKETVTEKMQKLILRETMKQFRRF